LSVADITWVKDAARGATRKSSHGITPAERLTRHRIRAGSGPAWSI